MDQASPASDKKLHELSQRIGFAKGLIGRATVIHDTAWETVRSLFAEHPKLGKRFLANDGFYLQDQRKEGTSKLVESELYEKMNKHWEDDPETFKRMWVRVTSQPARVVDSFKLEREVNKGNIPTELYKSCIHTPDPTYSRIHQSWTKEDYNRAVVLDVVMEDTETIKARQIAMLEEILAELRGPAVPSAQ